MPTTTLLSRSWRAMCLLVLLCAARAEAASLTLAWDPSPTPDVVGYTILYGTQPGVYTGQINVALKTEHTISSLPDGFYYFTVQAYTADGLASNLSNEIPATIGTPQTSLPTTTPPGA